MPQLSLGNNPAISRERAFETPTRAANLFHRLTEARTSSMIEAACRLDTPACSARRRRCSRPGSRPSPAKVTVRSEPDFNLNSAQAQSTVSMFDVQDASEVFVEAGPSGKGFGGDASSAGYNAAGKLGGGLIRLIQKKIEALR
jgi:hypothetical protein